MSLSERMSTNPIQLAAMPRKHDVDHPWYRGLPNNADVQLAAGKRPSRCEPPASLCEDCRDHWVERVAIHRFDGGVSLVSAAQMATEQVKCDHFQQIEDDESEQL